MTPSSPPRPGRDRGALRRFGLDVVLVVLAFTLGTVIAELAGATNLGTALTFGQIAFAATVLYLLLRR